MPQKSIVILLVEDNPVDALLIKEIIDRINEPDTAWKLIHADCLVKGLETLKAGHVDAILLDLSLPDSQGYDTFLAVQKTAPDIPIIMFTVMNDEALAIRAVHDGAQDYLVKGYINYLALTRSIRYSIERKKMEQERERLISELKESLAHVRTLSGLLPICAACKKVRDDQGYWHQVEQFVKKHTDVDFTHSICPECVRKMYPGYLSGDTKG